MIIIVHALAVGLSRSYFHNQSDEGIAPAYERQFGTVRGSEAVPWAGAVPSLPQEVLEWR